VLRWRRKGAGLRGFRPEMDINENDDEDEDILKVFRKQKVDVEIEKAVSRVMSMVDSPDARDQYRRMLEKYRQAKVNYFLKRQCQVCAFYQSGHGHCLLVCH